MNHSLSIKADCCRRQSHHVQWYASILLILSTITLPLIAQQNFTLQLLNKYGEESQLPGNINFRTTFSDSNLIKPELLSLVHNLHKQAYLEASIDSIIWNDRTAYAHFHLGKQYEWAHLRNGNVPEDFIKRTGFHEGLFRGKMFNRQELNRIHEGLLSFAENTGFPFASVFLDSINIDTACIIASLFLKPGRLVFFDSLTVEGDAGVSESYLRSYLGIKKGEVFSRRKILKITDRLRAIEFISETQSAKVTFWEELATVKLFLERRKASRFDFLLGFLPDNRRETNRLILTGTFLAALQNQLGMGEQFSMSFERLRPQTQKLDISASIPYVLDLPFGFEGRFYQYKRDTTYTDIEGRIGISYLIEGGTYLKAFSKTEVSNLINVDTAAIRKGISPQQLDVKTSVFGLEANWQQLDYRLNPRHGWNIVLSAGTGFRKIRKNQAVILAAPEFYDTLGNRSIQVHLEGSIERYFPVFQNSSIKTSLHGAALIAKSPVYQNELYRLGGNKTLRGFDEESVFANSFAVFSLEYRLLAGQNSYFYLFGDYAFLFNRPLNMPIRLEQLLGLGAGLTFETNAGMFAVSLAIGKPEGIGIDLRNPKLHFGYITYF